MSSTDTTKHGEGNNNIDTITEDIDRVVISEDSKKDTDKECTSCEQNDITEGIDSVALMNVSTCASCGKEGNSEDMNICNKCKSVKYCNAACKKKHRHKHKKACERRVAELHEEQLFKEPPPNEDCPICFLTLPLNLDGGEVTFYTCCGKTICNGCILAMLNSEGKSDLCPFCRMPNTKTDQDDINRLKKQMDRGNGKAFNHFAGYYYMGTNGVPQDYQRANELLLKAGNLGCADGYYNLGLSYRDGRGFEVDIKKAMHYFELAAMMGDMIPARQNLGVLEHRTGNDKRAMKHLMIAAKAGSEKPMNAVKSGFTKGQVTKDEYESTLRAYHERQKTMKSDARDEAAALLLSHNRA